MNLRRSTEPGEPPEPGGTGAGPGRGRGLTPIGKISLIVAGALMISAASWLAGGFASNDGNKQKSLVVPTASLITAPVEDRVVVESLNGRATLGFANVTAVVGPAKGGRVTATPLGSGRPVAEGDVLVEVDGRPTFALMGEVPMYRPLLLGSDGADVLGLEAALARLGIDPGPVDGVFDISTEAAVRELFLRSGYQPVEPTAEQEVAYSSAKEAETKAELTVIEAENALQVDEAGLDPGERASLDQAIDDADAQVAKLQREASALNERIAAETNIARAALEIAEQQRRAIADQMAESSQDSASNERAASLNSTHAQASLQVLQAQAALDTAIRDAPNARADAEASVAQAQRAAMVARRKLEDALVSKERHVLMERLNVARNGLDAARSRLADQAAIVGAGIQSSEVVFFDSLPQRVQQLSVDVGDEATGELMTVAGGDLVGYWFVTATERERLTAHGPVELTDSLTGSQIGGTIADIASSPGDRRVSATSTGPAMPEMQAAQPAAQKQRSSESTDSSKNSDKYLITIALTRDPGSPSDSQLLGRDMAVNAPVSESERGLAVPLAAVSSRPDGTAIVRIDRGGADPVGVGVILGSKGGGFIRVTPADRDSLSVGDRVVVGS